MPIADTKKAFVILKQGWNVPCTHQRIIRLTLRGHKPTLKPLDAMQILNVGI